MDTYLWRAVISVEHPNMQPDSADAKPAGVDNIYLNTVITGATDVAFITAPLGSILNSNVSAEDVQGVGGVGGNTLLFALNNIGSATDPISTAVGHIEGDVAEMNAEAEKLQVSRHFHPLAADLRELLQVGLGAGGDRLVDDLLGDATAERDADLPVEVFARVGHAI